MQFGAAGTCLLTFPNLTTSQNEEKCLPSLSLPSLLCWQKHRHGLGIQGRILPTLSHLMAEAQA